MVQTISSQKEVAKYFGFSWRADDAGGGNSMAWYKTWKESKDSDLKEKIIGYNEDDVKATQIILDKLRK